MSEPDHTDWRALCYREALRARHPELSVDEIAFLVAERYPHTASRLADVIAGRTQQGEAPPEAAKAKAAGA